MESNQPRVEEVEFDNIVKRELQPPKPPKRKKKKVSFAVWWELYAPEELKISAENIKQQDASLVVEKGSIAKAQETVDQQGDRPTPESESNEKKQVPFKTCLEEHVPVDQEISAGNIEKQNESLVSEEESIARVQETIDMAEKEQPSKPKEQPPTTRRHKKKKIPFHIWLEKHGPADLRTAAESTGSEDASIVTKQESISVLQETPEKEQSFKSCAESVNKQDTSLPEEGDQKDSLKKESFKEEPVISTQLVTKQKSISKSQKKVDQKREKQRTKTKRIKKTPLLWKSFPESDACVDLTVLTQNGDVNNSPLPEKPSNEAALPSRGKKTIWKVFPEPEPHIDLNFFADFIEGQDVSVPAKDGEQKRSYYLVDQPKGLVSLMSAGCTAAVWTCSSWKFYVRICAFLHDTGIFGRSKL
ncbi:class A basic helix-loop-helix protein 15 isoform X1 [Poeciliopsis prolifica]|uniref:class A basic helix-loop-helix protein 15 isoform X1 n=1 Tax=Poeciliopsis prolifica TaxID=188132 RepID=UPI002413F534|nr:class A basic helix-loop-helix protein 15 isoform X1 [Poeciliopsis prolifica]